MQLKKVAVLTPLAFGPRVTLDQVLRLGVQKLELLDLQVASELGYRVSCCPHRGY
jgi:homoserine dehydrogenase